MDAIRWKISKALNAVAWWIMPEPHRSNMERAWDAVGPEWLKQCVKIPTTPEGSE